MGSIIGLAFSTNHQRRETFGSTLSNVFISGIVDQRKYDLSSPFYVGSVKFFQFIHNDTQHIDGHFCFFSVIGLDIDLLIIIFSSFLLVGLIVIEHIFNQLEERRHDSRQILGEVFLHDHAESLPSGKQITLLRVSFIQLSLLDHNHEINQLVTLALEDIPFDCMGNQSKAFNQLASQLSVFLSLVALQHSKQESAHFLVEFSELFSSCFRTGSDGSNAVFLHN